MVKNKTSRIKERHIKEREAGERKEEQLTAALSQKNITFRLCSPGETLQFMDPCGKGTRHGNSRTMGVQWRNLK